MDKDNWFSTGDVASLDPLGFMRITDRSKDVIKSGGEWISSIEIENMAVSHDEASHSGRCILSVVRVLLARSGSSATPGTKLASTGGKYPASSCKAAQINAAQVSSS